MDAVLLATLAGVLFGAFAVAVRAGLRRAQDPEGGAFVTAALGFLVAALVALPVALLDGVDLGGLWAFALVGAIVPGLSQIAYVRAIPRRGPLAHVRPRRHSAPAVGRPGSPSP